MKYLIITLLTVVPIFLSAQVKVNCDKIIKDNAALASQVSALQQDTLFLRQKLAYFEAMNANNTFSVSSFNSQFEIKILSCFGDRSSQTVTIEFILRHKKANQEIGFVNPQLSKSYDEMGNAYEIKDAGIGSVHGKYIQTMVPTDINVRCFMTFGGIIGGTDKFKLVQLKASSKNNDGGGSPLEGFIEIKNIVIKWL